MANLAHIIVVFFMAAMSAVGAHNYLLGVYYGLAGNNLPPPWKVVQLCLKYNIKRVRLEEPDLDVLEAFRGVGIDLSFSMPNDQLTNMKTNNSAVEEWFNTYVEPFIDDFTIDYIIVGNKVIPGLEDCILPVMKSLQNILNAHYLGRMKLTTLVGYNTALEVKGLPSSSVFNPTASENIKDILQFMSGEGSPLMVSVYPYERYAYSRRAISLNYALFNSKSPVIHDQTRSYYNLFDAMVDAFYVAIGKLLINGDMAVVVGETGWPTCGHEYATTTKHAAKYNKNFWRHITSGKGTPRMPNIYIQGFIEGLFNENEKPEGESRCFGMFHVNFEPMYPLFTSRPDRGKIPVD